MVKKFGNVTRTVTRELFDLVSAYSDALIDEAAANGWTIRARTTITRESSDGRFVCALPTKLIF
jgi:hypothetical protein